MAGVFAAGRYLIVLICSLRETGKWGCKWKIQHGAQQICVAERVYSQSRQVSEDTLSGSGAFLDCPSDCGSATLR